MNHRHAKRCGAHRHRATYSPEADDTQLLAAKLHPEELVERPSLPVAATDHALAFPEAACYSQHQRHREICSRIREDVRRIRHDDTQLAGHGDIDVVEADADIRDDLEGSTRLEHR